MGSVSSAPAPPPQKLYKKNLTVSSNPVNPDEPREQSLSGAELINPYNSAEEKSKQVEKMFDSIATSYDFMNNAMSFGLHRYWRNYAIGEVLKLLASDKEANSDEGGKGMSLLDIATGTGDVAFYLHSHLPLASITGVDLSDGMLRVAREKLSRLPENERILIDFLQGDSLALQIDDNRYHLVTVAYGVRNFEHLAQGLREMWRVLRPGGMICIIELSVPRKPALRQAYNLYSRHLIPAVGRMVSGDSRAYSYLPESIAAAPQRENMVKIMTDAGFVDAKWKSLTFGVVTYYIARKPE